MKTTNKIGAIALIDKFYQAFATCNFEIYKEILSNDWQNIPSDFNNNDNGINVFLKTLTKYHSCFKNLVLIKDEIVCDKNIVVCRLTIKGNLIKPLGDWNAQKDIFIHGMDMHYILNNKIVKTYHFERQ